MLVRRPPNASAIVVLAFAGGWACDDGEKEARSTLSNAVAAGTGANPQLDASAFDAITCDSPTARNWLRTCADASDSAVAGARIVDYDAITCGSPTEAAWLRRCG